MNSVEPVVVRWLAIIVLLLAVSGLAFTANAQTATATFSGVIVDQNGAVVPGVQVALTNTATALERTATSNDNGDFAFPLLPPGNYTLTAKREGFKVVRAEHIVLNVGNERSLRVQLIAGDVSEAVNVTGEEPLINESPTVSTLVDRQFVNSLPLNGRSFQSLITLAPGVVTVPVNAANKGQFSVNGQRSTSNYFTVDGVSANIGANVGDGIAQDFSGALPGLTTFGGTNSLVSVDALQEFRVQTSSFAPEFGRTPGGQIQILTRSGTNSFHGTGFEYFRNDVLDAADWFVNANRLAKPALRQNDFGFVFGGPVLLLRFGEGKDVLAYNGRTRTFFFLSYEGLRLRQPQAVNRIIAAIRLRQLAPAALQPFLNALPLPTGPEIGSTGQAPFAASFSNPSALNATAFRIDHTFSSKFLLFGRYNDAPSHSITRNLSELTTTKLSTRTLTMGLTSIESSGMSNELLFNYSRVRGQSFRGLDNFGGAVPFPLSSIVPSAFLSQPSAVLFTFGALGQFSPGVFNDNFQRQFNVVDNLSVMTGGHQLKFGFDYRRLMPVYSPRAYSQSVQFLNNSSIQNGRATAVSIFAIKRSRPLFTNFSAYGQDSWTITPQLTLTYGLRWDVNPPPSEANGNLPFALTGLETKSTIAFAPAGSRLYQTSYDNFAPRIGLAYQLRRSSGTQTILRGGFGVFYDLANGQTAEAFTRHPFSTGVLRSLLRDVPFPIPTAQADPPSFDSLTPPFQINGFDPNLKLPYTLQWNLTVEQALGINQTISVMYVGNAGRRLIRTQTISNPNPTFSSIAFSDNGNTSDYNALQLQFNRRLSRGLQALVSYTWAHAIDEISDEGLESSPVGVRGNSDFDIRHSLSVAATYNLPAPSSQKVAKQLLGDWSADVILHLQSAPPFTVFSGTELDAEGRLIARRVSLIPSLPIYLTDQNAPGGKRLNDVVDPARPGCKGPFCPAPAGTQGDLGRNVLRAFALRQLDVGLRRQFNFTERLNLQFRAEVFNVLNHPNFGPFETSLTNALFGRATRTFGQSLNVIGGGFSSLYQIGTARSVQLGLKLSF